MEYQTIVRLFLVVTLGTCCLMQVKESLDKYLSGKKTMTIEKRKQDHATMPSISVCSSNTYKVEEMVKNNMTVRMQNSSFGLWPNDPKNVESAWKNITFSMEEVVKLVETNISGVKCAANATMIQEANGNICNVKVKSFGSLFFGQCFTFELASKATSKYKDYIILILHLSEDSKHGNLKLYIHPPGNELSLATVTWMINPVEIILNPKVEVNVVATMKESIDQDHCLTEVTEADFFECFTNHTRHLFYDKDHAKLCCKYPSKFGNCTIPHVSDMYEV
jgi:hypothetical protein